MGNLIFGRLKQIELGDYSTEPNLNKNNTVVSFPNLDSIPNELSLEILKVKYFELLIFCLFRIIDKTKSPLFFHNLKHLNEVDLCLASCVWQSLANDEILWQSLCKKT